MAGTADTRQPGQSHPDYKGRLVTNPKEMSAGDYYAGLFPEDADNVKAFLQVIREASGNEYPEHYGVFAYGSTTRPEDRTRAHDIDIKVLSSGKGLARARMVEGIRDGIREYYAKLGIPFDETEQTFRWGGNIHWVSGEYGGDPGGLRGSYTVPNEDPSFVVRGKGLPLHISIAGLGKATGDEWIAAERQGDKAFAVLL